MLGILALINVAVLGLFHLAATTSGNTPASTKPSRSCWPWCMSTLVGAVFLLDHRRAASHPRVLRLVLHAHILHGRYPFDLFRVMRQKRRALVPRSACDRPRTLVGGRGGQARWQSGA